MYNPKISVIIPVYNAEKTIGIILGKLITQDYENIEIIAINDGSKDRSLTIIQEFSKKDSRVVLVDQKNAGASIARNVGMSKATGELVLFIDSDDDFSEGLVSMLVASSAKDIDFVMCGMSINGRHMTARSGLIEGHKAIVLYVLNSLLVRNLFYGPYCKLFRRSYIEKFGVVFPANIKYGEDTIFVLSYLFNVEKISVIEESLYSYNLQPSGLAVMNRANSSFRKARSRTLKNFVSRDLSIRVIAAYLLVRVRWSFAAAKSKLLAGRRED